MNCQNALKEICKSIFMKLFSLFPQRKTIILESRPAFSDNTYAVYQELIRRGISKKYRIIWFVNPKDRVAHHTDSEVFVIRSSFINSVKKIYLLQTAAFVITCNRAYFSTRKNHHNIHLTHGSPLKDTASLMYLDPSYDCLTLAADFFKDFAKRDFNISTAKMVVTGMPRTDYYFCTPNESLRKLVRSDYRKLIIWMPTLRQSGNGKRIDSSYNMPYGIPIFQTEEEWESLNHILHQNNSMLIIKYHFAQDADVVCKMTYSNIKIVGNDYFDEIGIQLYDFLRYTDALITDYSSIYFDYLLLDNPIGLTIDDLSEYSAGRGFLVDDIRTVFQGNYMKTFRELFAFIQNVCEGSAEFTSDMKKAKKKYNDYSDGLSSSRVVEYLIERYGL